MLARARFANVRWALRAQLICKLLGLIDFSNAFSSSVLVRFVFGGSFLSSIFPKTFWLKVAFLIGLLHFSFML